MLEKKLAERVLLKALDSGADFSEIFAEKTRSSFLKVGDGKVDSVSANLRLGVGVRVFKDDFCGYAYTNDLSEEGLLKAAAEAAIAIRSEKLISSVNLVSQEIENKHKCEISPLGRTSVEKADWLKQFSEYVYGANARVARVDMSQSSKMQDILVANSEGLWVEDSRIRTRVGFSVKVEQDDKCFENFWTNGQLQGLEMIDKINAQSVAEQTVREAIEMLKAENCPAGKLPVVLAKEIGGVLFHEACGHSLEATAVAKNASVFCNRLGQKIASPLVTLIDDGTLPNQWGSTNIDDEGVKTQHNVLIEKGILKGYLVDRFNGRRMNMSPTGSSRRESYEFVPTSRMNNTYIVSGESLPEDIIASTPNGIFAAQIKGGSVNTETGDFNFSVSRAYLIENGKITKPVKGAKLIGNGADILQKIDMIANDSAIKSGGQCGSVSGWVPVSYGTPTLRVSEIAVGGQK